MKTNQKQFNIECKIKSLETDFGFNRDIVAKVENYARLAKMVKVGSLGTYDESNDRLIWAAEDAVRHLENNPINYNCAPNCLNYWQTLAELMHNVYNENEHNNAWLAYDDAATSYNKAGDRANDRALKADNILCNPSGRRSSTLAKLEDESQEAHELAAYMWEESSKWRNEAEELTEAAADMADLVAMVDNMAELMTEWDQLKEDEAAAVLADIMADKEADKSAIVEPVAPIVADNTPAEVEEPEATKEMPVSWPDGLTASGSSNEYIFGRVGRSAWVNFAKVSPYLDRLNFAPLWLQYHGPEKNIIKYICDELGLEARRGRSCRWNGDHTIHEQRFFLYDGLDEDGCPNVVAVLNMTTARREVAAELLIKWWWNRSDLNPRNAYYRQPASLPAPAEVETVAAPTNQKTASPSVKKFSWSDVPEDEQHPEPQFYKDLRDFAHDHNIECIEAYKTAASVIDEELKNNPSAWKNIIPGSMLWLDDCGMKMDNASNIGNAIDEMIMSDKPQEWNDEKSTIRRQIAMVEKIIETTDEDLQLFPYNDQLPEGCARGGSRCDDEEAQARARERWQKYRDEAAEKKYYGYWFTCVTMFRSPNYCIFIDAEGYTWCRYLLFLPTWRDMYAADVKAAEDAEQRRQEEAAADRMLEEAKALLQYNADCDQIRPFMVADLSQYGLYDRKGRQNGRRRNILAVLRHYYPGQKFSVRYRFDYSYSEIEINWIDGPTCEEVENVCNWSIFCDSWRHFDGMDDSWDGGNRQFQDFAQQYGGGNLCEITCLRDNSNEKIEQCQNYARNLFESLGLDNSQGYAADSEEGREIYRNCPYLNQNKDVYNWYSVYSIANIMARQIAGNALAA